MSTIAHARSRIGLRSVLIAPLVLLKSATASAATLIAYRVGPSAANTAPHYVATGITGNNLTVRSGLTVMSDSYDLVVSGISQTNAADAVAANEMLTFGFTVASNKTIDITGVSIGRTEGVNESVLLASYEGYGRPYADTEWAGISATGIVSSTTFRLVLYRKGATAGSYTIYDSRDIPEDGDVFNVAVVVFGAIRDKPQSPGLSIPTQESVVVSNLTLQSYATLESSTNLVDWSPAQQWQATSTVTNFPLSTDDAGPLIYRVNCR